MPAWFYSAMRGRAGSTAKAGTSTEELSFSLVLREPALFVLAALLLLSYSLFPRGYMPARTVDGATIVLCSAVGLDARSVDSDGDSRPRRHIGSVKCDIAGGPTAAVLDTPMRLAAPAPILAATPLWPVSAASILFRSLFDPNAPPTAPPLLTP